MKYNLNKVIDNFIKKILFLEQKNDITISTQIKEINVLLSNLIDYCIKQKVSYYIDNEIGYNKINDLFRKSLYKYLKNIVDPDDNIDTTNLEYKSLKNEIENNKNSGTKVSFNNEVNIIKYDEFDNEFKNEFNVYDNIKNSDDDEVNNKNLAIYIKIFISKDENVLEFIEKITEMCKIICE